MTYTTSLLRSLARSRVESALYAASASASATGGASSIVAGAASSPSFAGAASSFFCWDSLSPSDLPRRSFGTCRLVLGLCDFFPIQVSCPARRSLSPSDRLARSGCTRPRDQPRDVRAAVSDLCRLCRRGFAGTLSRSDRIDRICGTNRLSLRKIRLFRRTREYPPSHKISPCGQTRRICCIECCSSQALEYPASRSLAPSGQSCRIGCTYRSTKALWRSRHLRYRTQSRRLGCYPDSREPSDRCRRRFDTRRSPLSSTARLPHRPHPSARLSIYP